MRFDSISIGGIGPFAATSSVNFNDVPGVLVAITGENGAGKSTLLECLAAALYRDTPTRGSLSSLATARDSFVEVGVTNGHSYTIRQTLDAISGKAESLVTDMLGKAITTSGKLREFDEWAKNHLPPPSVFYSSVFAAQGSGGFLDAKPGDRKAILLRVLGCEHLEELAKRARDHAAEAKQNSEIVRARANEARSKGTDVAEAEALLSDAQREQQLAQIAVDQQQEELSRLQLLATAAAESFRAGEEYVRRLRDLRSRLTNAEAALADVNTRIANNQGLIDRADEISVAVLQAALIESERIRPTENTISETQSSINALASKINLDTARSRTTQLRIDGVQKSIEQANSRLTDKARIEAAVAGLPDAQLLVEEGEATYLGIEQDLRQLASQQLASDSDRIKNLRDGLNTIAAGMTIDPRVYASATLAVDNQAMETEKARPARTSELTSTLDAAREALTEARESLRSIERTSQRAEDLKEWSALLIDAESELKGLQAEAAEVNARLLANQPEIERLQNALFMQEQTLVEYRADRAKLEPTVRLAQPLKDAQTRLSELEIQLRQAQSDGVSIVTEIANLGEAPEVLPAPDVRSAETYLRTLNARSIEASSKVAIAQNNLDAARDNAGRLQELEAELRRNENEQSDWTRLAADLGRDGLQALEIDAAGPELTELINDLLRSCVGSRWSVSVETTRASSDGKRQLEGCEVRVLDTFNGRNATAETLSGGERVIVGESIALALSMLACRRSGVVGPTLIRDESGAALDPVNGRNYLAMLRRAAEIVGASKVLFVSHSQELQELADAQIRIAGGRVFVPGAQEVAA